MTMIPGKQLQHLFEAETCAHARGDTARAENFWKQGQDIKDMQLLVDN